MSILDDLMATIESRRSADPDSSWTAQLLEPQRVQRGNLRVYEFAIS